MLGIAFIHTFESGEKIRDILFFDTHTGIFHGVDHLHVIVFEFLTFHVQIHISGFGILHRVV